VSLAYERWYEVTPGGMREVLSLPLRGHECPDAASLCRAFAVQVEKAKSGHRRVQVLFQAQYDGNRFLLDGKSHAEIPLFSVRKRAVYVRPEGGADFVLSPRESQFTEEELRITASIGDFTCRDFLRFNGRIIDRLAAGRRSEARNWLRRYVTDCETSPAAEGEIPLESREDGNERSRR
jgi:hypothetical protein